MTLPSRKKCQEIELSRNILLSSVPDMLEALKRLTLEIDELSNNASLTKPQLEAIRARTGNRKVQIQAINSWLDRAGIIPPRAQTDRPADLPLADMTVSELRRLADTLDSEIAERAKVINAPVKSPTDATDVDSLI